MSKPVKWVLPNPSSRTNTTLTVYQQGSGAGPFAPGTYKTDNSLQGHTIYYPTKSTGNAKMPVLVWGNGACSTDGRSNSALLQNIASYGFLAIAEGGPNGGGSSNAGTMKAAIDWVTKIAGTGAYANVDATRIMAAGFSCGGVEAIDNIGDSRVDTIGVISSGLLQNTDAAKSWRKPVLFVLGGNGDIAFANVSCIPHAQSKYWLSPQGERDYNNMPNGVPTWKGNINVGHGGTLGDANGGRFGKAILNWMLWTMKNDTNAANYFTSGYQADGYQVQSKSLNLLKPFWVRVLSSSTCKQILQSNVWQYNGYFQALRGDETRLSGCVMMRARRDVAIELPRKSALLPAQ
jgi:hypothetical protein